MRTDCPYLGYRGFATVLGGCVAHRAACIRRAPPASRTPWHICATTRDGGSSSAGRQADPSAPLALGRPQARQRPRRPRRRSRRAVRLRLGDHACDQMVPEPFEGVDLGVRPALRFGDAADGQRSRAPGEGQGGKSRILAGTVGEGASQIDTGFDQCADVDEVAELRSAQKSA
jgi:hypothetical protein